MMEAETCRTLTICGLPGSGKTTFLAALWSLISDRELSTKLSFASLLGSNKEYLNQIVDRWARAIVQERTLVDDVHHVNMLLRDDDEKLVKLSFPDLSGENYSRMWEDRECELALAANIRESSGFVFLVNADTTVRPQGLTEAATMSGLLDIPFGGDAAQPFHPKLCPTQVQVVDILQNFQSQHLNAGSRRLCLMLSAWDKVSEERKTPESYLADRMPLLDQYLRNSGAWEYRMLGLSAQGCDYEDPTKHSAEVARQAAAIRELTYSYERIHLIDGDDTGHDLTEPLAWLTSW